MTRNMNAVSEQPDHQKDAMPVLIVQSRLAPFRVPVFEALAHACPIVVYYGDRSINGIAADPPHCPTAVYSNFHTYFVFGRFEFHWKMIRQFIHGQYRSVIVEGKLGFLTAHVLMAIARMRGLRVVVWTSAFDSEVSSFIQFAKDILTRLYLRRADAVLAYGSKARNRLLQLGIPSLKIHIAYNSVDTRLIEQLRRDVFVGSFRNDFRKQFGVDQEDSVVLYVGRIETHKKVDILLRAFCALQSTEPRLKLWIVGNGDARRTLEEQAKAADVNNVKFWGAIMDGREVNKIFHCADVFVMPGLGGLALQQAVANGLPCVVAEADGTEEDLVIPGANGFFFERDNAEALAASLMKLANAPALRAAMGAYSLKISSEKVNMERMVKSMLATVEHEDGNPD